MNYIASIENIQKIERGESDFHYRFSLIKSPPKVIYYLGDINLLNRPILGIVGPRNPSEYARTVVSRLFDLAPEYDLVTVSGMADGIDSLAHKLSITHDIPTIAVLGGGLERFLKSANRAKIEKIVESGGLVISEFALDLMPANYTFPQRNRIIAGLSDVLFLPEAMSGSGSLITVDFALQMHKPIYATPNHIFAETSGGVHTLISNGTVKPVFDFNILLDKFFSQNGKNKPAEIINYNFSDEELGIIEALREKDQLSLTELSSITHIPGDQIVGIITMLEINTFIYEIAPGVYKKK